MGQPNDPNRLNQQIEELARTWALRPRAEALQVIRGIADPRQFIAYLGLMPFGHSSVQKIQHAGIAKAGNWWGRHISAEAWRRAFPEL